MFPDTVAVFMKQMIKFSKTTAI